MCKLCSIYFSIKKSAHLRLKQGAKDKSKLEKGAFFAYPLVPL
jgi:hypothetical protein